MICNICPRECGIDRKTEKGICGCGDKMRISRAAPHFWEEPPISHKNGSGTVFSETILTEEDAKSHGEAFYLLYNLIDYIKAGDHESYNSCFSSYYFKTSQPQGKFTKQKIYDIIITELPTESKSADGVSFMEYNYTIEYRIRHNNGSFRRDIGSDQSKKQYVKLSERSGEGVLIDRIYTVTHTVVD